jgi:hypothetical protein
MSTAFPSAVDSFGKSASSHSAAFISQADWEKVKSAIRAIELKILDIDDPLNPYLGAFEIATKISGSIDDEDGVLVEFSEPMRHVIISVSQEAGMSVFFALNSDVCNDSSDEWDGEIAAGSSFEYIDNRHLITRVALYSPDGDAGLGTNVVVKGSPRQ